MLDVVLIGRGAIASEVLKHISSGREVAVTGFIVRPGREVEARAALPATIQVASAIEYLSTVPGLIAECAGHSAVAEFGEKALRRGIDFLVISIGALADAGLRARLEAAAEAGGAKLILPAGAIAGADALTAARIGGLERVVYTSRKPPASWRGTLAEDARDLNSLTEPTVIFEGAADEAATLYPRNANVAATIALAGAGFDRTDVRLVADPDAGGSHCPRNHRNGPPRGQPPRLACRIRAVSRSGDNNGHGGGPLCLLPRSGQPDRLERCAEPRESVGHRVASYRRRSRSYALAGRRDAYGLASQRSPPGTASIKFTVAGRLSVRDDRRVCG